jgi:REP element-mobilizing transposase RayT
VKYDSEKQHRRSLRLKNRDYSRNGYYFVTICARNRENIFANFSVGARLALAPNSPDNDQRQPRGLFLQQKTVLTLGDIIGSFKSRCAMDYLKYIDENHLNESAKIWQRNYYEHIIRDRKELAAIRNYIKSNPYNWTEDEENPLNL